MYANMTQAEFKALRKLVNKAKKHVSAIGDCNEYETELEGKELLELQATAAELLKLTLIIENKYKTLK